MSPETPKPILYTTFADEIKDKHPHGQIALDYNGGFVNFACEVDEESNVPLVTEMIERLQAWKADPEQWVFEFDSPHLPGRCYLLRPVLEHITGVMPAWSAKVLPRPRQDSPLELRDAASGVPLIRRVPARRA
jgi:hypothetical protein